MQPITMKYLYAMLFGILAFTLKNIGYTLQKKGINEVVSIPGQHRAFDYFKNRIWVAGLALPFAGALVLVVAYFFGPLSIVMPFMGTGLVALVIFCKFFLKESIKPVEWMSVIINCAGIVLLGAFGGSVQDSSLDLAKAAGRITNLSSMFFLCSPLVVCACVVLFARSVASTRAGSALGASAGIFGGASLIMQKLMSYGIRDYAKSFNPAAVPGIVLSGLLVVTLSILAVWTLTEAFHRGKAIVIAPVYSAIQMLFPIMGGIFIFGEWNLLPILQRVIETTGILMVVVSIVILSVYDEKRTSIGTSCREVDKNE